MLNELGFALPLLEQFGMFVGGLVLYGFFIFSFYKHVSKRLLFELSMPSFTGAKHPVLLRLWRRFVYALKYLFLSPFLFFLWGTVITVILLVFDGSGEIAVETTLLIAMALLAAIRITAYINQELSAELAKTLPLSMLAVFLLDMTAVSVTSFLDKLSTVPSLLPQLSFFFACVVVLEFTLRLIDAVVKHE